MRLFGEAVLDGIELARTTLKHHEIKLLRNLAMTAKTAFSKLVVDYEAIKDCEECEEDREVIRADQEHLMTLIQFIMHGLAPLAKNPSVDLVFSHFNETNHEAISERVDRYL